MELKEFIKAAITDITEAISELQSGLDNGAIINPSISRGEYGKAVLVDQGVAPIEHLNFDVAVTATEASSIGGDAKAGISIFGAKIGTETNAKTENVSRLTFSVPIVFRLRVLKPTSNLIRVEAAKDERLTPFFPTAAC